MDGVEEEIGNEIEWVLAAAALLALLAGLFAFATAPVGAADVKVIANPSVTVSSISATDLKEVFLANKTDVDGSPVEPVLSKGGAAHEAFLKQYLGKSDSALSTYYRSLVFTGKGTMPKALESDAEVGVRRQDQGGDRLRVGRRQRARDEDARRQVSRRRQLRNRSQ